MNRKNLISGFQRMAGLLLLVLIGLLVGPRGEDGSVIFIGWANVTDILRQISEIGIIALAMTLVITTAGIDLCVGSMLALSASLSAKLLTQWHPGIGAVGHIGMTIVLAIVLTTLLGALNGALIANLRVQPFIVTLAAMIGIRGLARYLCDNANIDLGFGGESAGALFAQVLSNKSMVIGVFLLLAIIFALLLRKTVFGRYVRALGDNAMASHYAGLPVKKIQTAVYALSGLMAGIAGVIHCAQNNQGSPNDGMAYELDAIAAVVIGGTSLAGGSGSIIGTIIGTLIVGVLTNIFRLKGVDINVEMMVKAGIIIGAVWLQHAGLRGAMLSASARRNAAVGTLLFACVVAALMLMRPAVERPRYHVIFSQCNNAEPYRAAQNTLLKKLLAEHQDITLEIMDAQQDNSRQISQIETAIHKKPDLLIVAPNERGPLTEIMGKAMQAGTPVMCLERDILEPHFNTFIKCDNYAIGCMAGQFIVDHLKKKYGTVRGKIVEIHGLLGTSGETDRCNGAHDVWEDYPGIEVVQDAVANWIQSQARDRMTEILRAQPEIDVVYGHNDPMAVGAYLAAKALGREKEMIFVGVDGLGGEAGGIRYVMDGVLAATFVYPLSVDKAVEIGIRMVREPDFVPEREYIIDSLMITTDNAEDEYRKRTLETPTP